MNTGIAMAHWNRLLAWAGNIGIDEVPEPAMDAAHRLLVDSLICGLAASNLERSRWLRELIEEQGGAPQASLSGSPRLVPATLAAMANAEMMNLLDADDTLLNGAHFGALVVAVALAEGQRTGASWQRVLAAIALGFEVNARLFLAPHIQQHLYPAGATILGATVAAAVVNGGTREQLASALGLAMKMAPTGVPLMVAVGELDSLKYAPYGALAFNAIHAWRLAAKGYVGNPAFGGGEPGFVHAQGAVAVDWQVVDVDLGTSWWITQTSLKPYPSFRLGHAALDALKKVMCRDSIRAEDILAIELQMDPRTQLLPMHANAPKHIANDHLAPIYTAMHLRYSLVMIALGVPPGPRWCAPEQLENPLVWSLVERISFASQPAVSLEALMTMAQADDCGRVRASLARVTLTTASGSFSATTDSCSGDPWHPTDANDWHWLRRKASSFLADAIPDVDAWFDALSLAQRDSSVANSSISTFGL